MDPSKAVMFPVTAWWSFNMPNFMLLHSTLGLENNKEDFISAWLYSCVVGLLEMQSLMTTAPSSGHIKILKYIWLKKELWPKDTGSQKIKIIHNSTTQTQLP